MIDQRKNENLKCDALCARISTLKNFYDFCWNFCKAIFCRDLKLNAFLSLAIIIWLFVAPSWYEWLKECSFGDWLSQCHIFLKERWFVNLPICIVLTLISCRWGGRIWQDEDVRLYRPLIVLLGLVLLFRCMPSFATIAGNFEYRCMLVLAMIVPSIAMIGKACKRICPNQNFHTDSINKPSKSLKLAVSSKETTSTVQGFTIDYDKSPNTSLSLEKYAEAIVLRLLHTDLTDNAYAIGITGKWGTGKTTFLDMLKNKFLNQVEIVDFNPWNSRTSEQVVEDFFATLHDELSPKHSSLSRPFREYAKLINSISFPILQGFSLTLNSIQENPSISKKKDQLSKTLKTITKPVVVLIDDLDRMEGNEVFEMLRLIRNTANLSNVIYVVAYDRDYVTNILEKKEILNPSDYLRKIFPVEVHLPKVEDNQIWDVLQNDLSHQNIFKFDFAQELTKHFDDVDRNIIIKVLDNYRNVKHFVRAYTLSLSYLYERGAYPKEHKLLDLFWLELLRMYDKDVYNILRDEPLKLLDNDEKRYYLREGISSKLKYNKKVESFDGVFSGKQFSTQILEHLFVSENNTSTLSISYMENYDKYFTLSVSSDKLSFSEFLQFLNSDNDCEKIVGKWVGKGKNISSILFQISKCNVNILNSKQLNNYLIGILYLCCCKLDEVYEIRKVRDFFLKKNFKCESVQVASKIVKKWFEDRIEQNVHLVETSRFLNHLFGTSYSYESSTYCDPVKPSETLIENDIVPLLISIISSYLENTSNLTAVDVLNSDKPFGNVLANCCVITKKDFYYTVEEEIPMNYYKQVSWEEIIEHFSKMTTKPHVVNYAVALEKFLHEKNQHSTTTKDEIESDNITNPFDINNLESIFGSDYKEQLRKFKLKCFEQDLISQNNEHDIIQPLQ